MQSPFIFHNNRIKFYFILCFLWLCDRWQNLFLISGQTSVLIQRVTFLTVTLDSCPEGLVPMQGVKSQMFDTGWAQNMGVPYHDDTNACDHQSEAVSIFKEKKWKETKD